MKSFDCFDTLIARRHITPESIFEEVGRRIGDPTFVQKRKLAEAQSNKTYADIYSRLSVDPHIELDVEMEHCYPIVRNMQQVSDNDLIVSDMYLPPEFIEKMLRKCGLDKDVTIIVTSGGKSKGTIWNQLKDKPQTHLGDNMRSDVTLPTAYGIKTTHSMEHELSVFEKEIQNDDKQMASFMRCLRLQSPFYKGNPSYHLWDDQSNLNIPSLIYVSLTLPEKNNLYFNYRDCVFLHPIYEKLTGKPSKRFDSSRELYKSKSEEYRSYIKQMGVNENSIIIDLNGSGKSPLAFFGNNLPSILYVCGYTIKNEKIKTMIGQGNAFIECHNISEEGSVTSFSNGKFIRRPCEYEKFIPQTQKMVVDLAINNLNFYKFKKNEKILKNIVEKMKNSETTKIAPIKKFNI